MNKNNQDDIRLRPAYRFAVSLTDRSHKVKGSKVQSIIALTTRIDVTKKQLKPFYAAAAMRWKNQDNFCYTPIAIHNVLKQTLA